MKNKLSILYNLIVDWYYDFALNINTSGTVKVTEGNWYQPSSYRALKKIFKEVDVKGKTLVDVGSGKGRVVFYAEHKGAAKCIGIELNEDLYKESLNNSLSCLSHTEHVCYNATEYIYSNCDIVFLFNPFNYDTMKKVMDRINETKNRPITIILSYAYNKELLNTMSGWKYEKTIFEGCDIFTKN